MSVNIINCCYYNNGMCLYINGKLAIHEECYVGKLPLKFRDELIKDCNTKRAIEIIGKSSLEKRLDNRFKNMDKLSV